MTTIQPDTLERRELAVKRAAGLIAELAGALDDLTRLDGIITGEGGRLKFYFPPYLSVSIANAVTLLKSRYPELLGLAPLPELTAANLQAELGSLRRLEALSDDLATKLVIAKREHNQEAAKAFTKQLENCTRALVATRERCDRLQLQA